MKVHIYRLFDKLKPCGYNHITLANGAAFVRIMPTQDIKHWIEIDWAGKQNEAMAASVLASVSKCVFVKATMTVSMNEMKLVADFPDITERGHVIIETAEAARRWEQRLVEVAPAQAAVLAAEHGPEMLRQTDSARTDAAAYLKRIDTDADVLDRLNRFRRMATPEQLAEAERLAEFAGVLEVLGAENIYLLSCLAITLFAKEVESDGRTFVGENPLLNRELMARIQLVADELLFRDGGDIIQAELVRRTGQRPPGQRGG